DFLVAIEPIIATTGTIGDANNAHEYEQGQFVIESNLITAAAQYGVRIDAGRDEGSDPDGNYVGVTNEPDLGVARNVPVQNNPRLVPGAVVNNNVITGAGAAGILFSGTTSTQAQPQSVVPYGRIINNTIFGGEGSTATGVDVNENAGPTLINNVFAELGVGVRVDTSSREDAGGDRRTVITTSAFHAVGVEVAGVEQELGLTLTKSPFVNAAGGNFYPTTGAAIVDSSLSSLQERNEYRVVTEAIGIASSPIIAPVRDIYGQLRVDDPQQATDEPGLGGSVFHDRGAVERADQSRPFARIVSPLDQGERPVDTDESLDSVVIEGAEARGIRTFAIQLNDVGVGIDKTTVTSDAFVVTRDGVRLLDTIDYRWVYNENTDQVLLQAISVFPIGEYLIAIDSAPADPVTGVAGRVTDRANNPIRRNVTGGAAAATFSIRLLDVPGLPTRGDAAAGDGEAVLSWVEPYSPPSLPILRYDVQQTGDGGESWSDWLPPSGGVLSVPPVTVPWANNQPLLYRVRAVNAIGVGNWSDPIAARASAVQGVSGVPGKNSVTLNWNPPLNDGGKPIDFYVVERSEDTGSTWIRVPIQAIGSSVTVTGLAKNVGQVFRVAAVNAAGVGSWSAATGEIVPQGTADAPTHLTAGIDPADGSVLLEWTGPELTGGVPLTGYQLAYTWVDQAGEDQSGSVPLGVVTSFDLSGLERSTGYTFTVLAKNAHGLSEPSTEVSLTTPDVIQSAPSRPTVVAGLERLELEWQPLTVADEELALVSYVLQVRGSGDTDWTTRATVPADDATNPRYTVVRSRNAGEAEFRVAARNTLAGVDDDDLVYSQATALTLPIARSGPVANLVGTVGNREVTLSWDAPLDLGGGTLLHYKVEFFDGTEWQTFEEKLVTERTVTISGLNNGSEYRFRVTPITSTPLGDTDAGEAGVAGAGAETGLVMPFGPATAVTNLTATAGVGQVTLQWNVPINEGGRSITGYVVEYATSATGPWLAHSDSDPTDLAAAIPEIVTELTQLEKQTEYYFRVAAVNEAGQSEFAAVVSATPTGLPDAPTGMAFAPDQGDGSLLTTWVEPQNTGALPVTYDVQYRKAGTGSWLDLADPDKTDRAADIPGL
ncbi:hypothetical protein EBU58_05265, partial [bacterium]|nr:hypothetical protein [bacterium]